jgi:hypothetical protein
MILHLHKENFKNAIEITAARLGLVVIVNEI